MNTVSDIEEKINNNTVKYIIKTLQSHTTFETDIKNDKTFLLIFLFSGVRPDCEYKLYQYIRSTIKPNIKINVILVDIYKIDNYYKDKYPAFFEPFTHQENFRELNTRFNMCGPKLLAINNIYCIGIHPQHNNPLIDIMKLNTQVYTHRPYTNNEKNIKFGMYDFFNIHYKNKPIIYVYNGNPDITDDPNKYKVIDNKVRLKTNKNNNNFIELKPPVIIIFCATGADPYTNILDTFKKGTSIFKIPIGKDVFASSITVKKNDNYVFNSCSPDNSNSISASASASASASNTTSASACLDDTLMNAGYYKLLNKKYKTCKKLITNHNKKNKKNKKTLKKIKNIKK